MNPIEEFRSALERQVRAESRHGWDNARKRWAKPLPERVLADAKSAPSPPPAWKRRRRCC